jgi:probable lipoprotein NlpC
MRRNAWFDAFLLPVCRIPVRYLVLAWVIVLPMVEGCKSSKGSKERGSWVSRLFSKRDKSGQSGKANGKTIDTVIKTARSYRGTPHRDGGVSRMGIDCSALMMLSFESAGVKIPRTARQQSEIGRPVDRKDLKPGDLVFFSDKKIGKGITHVGLVTEVARNGEIRFIHTSSRLGVTENLLSTDYFNRTYAKAVRPF